MPRALRFSRGSILLSKRVLKSHCPSLFQYNGNMCRYQAPGYGIVKAEKRTWYIGTWHE